MKKVVLLFTLIITAACNSPSPSKTIKYTKLKGKTMGTFYNITYKDHSGKALKHEIDSFLIVINNSLSTYIPNSTISKINNDTLGIIDGSKIKFTFPSDIHFIKNYSTSKIVFTESDSLFDPSIMPLVNYWGFGTSKKEAVENPDHKKISYLKSLVGFEKWELQKQDSTFEIIKFKNTSIDFSGIAKGYGVDCIAALLESKNIFNYFIEIGGEVMTNGVNEKGKKWTIGLSVPKVSADINQFQEIIQLSGKGMASSGNYRNFYEVDGRFYGHEINPKSGYPEINELLGVTVLANNCTLADAYATAYMVMGMEKSQNHVNSNPNLEACFFIRGADNEIKTVLSNGFQNYLFPEN